MDSNRRFLLALVGVLLALSTFLVVPFLQYILLAVVLAFVLAPAQRYIEKWVSPTLAAATVVLLTTVAIIFPLIVVSRTIAADATELIRTIRTGNPTIAEVEVAVDELTGIDVSLNGPLQAVLENGGSAAFGNLLDVFGAVTHALIGLGLSVFLLYYFLKDRDNFLRWLRWILPLSERVQNDLFEAVDEITWAVLAGHVFVALIQGAIGGIGLFAVGVPNSLFWTAVMVVLALLPIVGSFLVWGPAAVYLALTGRPLPAVVLVAYGTVVVGLSDNYLRPIIVDRYAHVNPSVIIVGVLGGLYALGFMGLFVGPIIIGVFRATLDVYRKEYGPTGAELDRFDE